MRHGLVAAVALAATFGASGANPQPRDSELRLPTEAVDNPDTATWLRRLVGRYTFDGVIQHSERVVDFNAVRDAPIKEDELPSWVQPIQGKGDCIAFSDGPGVQCVINVFWPEQWRITGKAQLGGVPDLTPGVVLAGVVPGTEPPAIRVLLVNFRGLGHPGGFSLRGNEATVRLPCVNIPGALTCEDRFSIVARSDSISPWAYHKTTVEYFRSKLDRKPILEESGDGAVERATEKVEEILEVSFTLRREPQATESTEDQASDLSPDQGSGQTQP